MSPCPSGLQFVESYRPISSARNNELPVLAYDGIKYTSTSEACKVSVVDIRVILPVPTFNHASSVNQEYLRLEGMEEGELRGLEDSRTAIWWSSLRAVKGRSSHESISISFSAWYLDVSTERGGCISGFSTMWCATKWDTKLLEPVSINSIALFASGSNGSSMNSLQNYQYWTLQIVRLDLDHW